MRLHQPSSQGVYSPGMPGDGNGDVVGPVASTDGAIALWDGTGGNTLKDSNLVYSGSTLSVPDGFTVSSAGSITLKTTGTGDLLINKNTAASTPWFDGTLMTGADATNTAFQVDVYGAQARYDVRRANGTKASPTTLTNADIIGGFGARGYDGSAYSGTTCSLLFKAKGTWSGSNLGTYFDIAVIPENQLAQVTAATFGSNSLLSLGNNATFPAWTTDGVVLNSLARTYTNGTSTGTVAAIALHSFSASTLAATNATTFTDAANVYIAGAPAAGSGATLTRSHALWIDSGSFRLDGTDGAGAGAGSLTNAPSAGNPDKWIPINSEGTQYWVPAWAA